MMLRRLRCGFWSAGLRLLPILFTWLRPHTCRRTKVVEQDGEIAVLGLARRAIGEPIRVLRRPQHQDGRGASSVLVRMDAGIFQRIRACRVRSEHPEELRGELLWSNPE